MFGLGPTELLIVGLIFVLLFYSRLPRVTELLRDLQRRDPAAWQKDFNRAQAIRDV